jgi:(E)-4-hydroxy-3-methylbut-2-enyl-diphosphate synthase
VTTRQGLVRLMVRKVLDDVAVLERLKFRDIKLSAKASDVPTTLSVYRALARRTEYPLHVGLTAAGTVEDSVVKSSVAIGTLLAEGIGDTIRVSLTGAPHDEVSIGRRILESLELREPTGVEIVSCPTCGRCSIDLERIVREVRRKLPAGLPPMKIAVMGCIVNGPGEARDCAFGVAGGKDFGYLFSYGEKLKKVPAKSLADELVALVTSRAAEQTP